MNQDELKKACEMAGGEVAENGRSCVFDRATPIGCRLDLPSPVLYAYVAELLTAKVRERSWLLQVEHDGACFWNCADRTRPNTRVFSYGDDGNTLSEAIIHAAMDIPEPTA